MDNAAPGLNFAAGNLVGINEIDIQSVELLPGAASALYGANAVKGIMLMNSKSPFDSQALVHMLKVELLAQITVVIIHITMQLLDWQKTGMISLL